jgi:imidazolonepropionase-like amidohydrolase
MRYAIENARRTLEAGVTTIRNLGAGAQVDIRLRDAIRRGEVAGPRMVVSGEPLTPDDLDGVEGQARRISYIRQFVRARIAEGVDVIKVFEGVDERGAPLFSREEIRAAVEEAARAGLKVAVHAHEAPAIKAAVEGGCASIEHGTFLDDEAIRLLVKNHVALVPTLYLPTHYIEHRDQFAFGNSTWTFFERLRARNMENLRRAKKAGVLIINGSDAVAGLHGQNELETLWLVKAGLTPAEAIRAATCDAAKLLGLDAQLGDIKEGKLADLIAVPADPLRDITSLERVAFVMQGGKVIKNSLGGPSVDVSSKIDFPLIRRNLIELGRDLTTHALTAPVE